MRVPSFERFRRLMQAAAFFVCGTIVGAAVFGAIQNDVVDRVLLANLKLKERLDEVAKELAQSEQLRKENVIRSIVVIIEDTAGKSAVDALTETKLKAKLKKDLSIFLGRSIYTIDSDARLARKLLEQKIYENVEDKDYEVTVRTMLVVDGVLQVWVEAKVHLPD